MIPQLRGGCHSCGRIVCLVAAYHLHPHICRDGTHIGYRSAPSLIHTMLLQLQLAPFSSNLMASHCL